MLSTIHREAKTTQHDLDCSGACGEFVDWADGMPSRKDQPPLAPAPRGAAARQNAPPGLGAAEHAPPAAPAVAAPQQLVPQTPAPAGLALPPSLAGSPAYHAGSQRGSGVSQAPSQHQGSFMPEQRHLQPSPVRAAAAAAERRYQRRPLQHEQLQRSRMGLRLAGRAQPCSSSTHPREHQQRPHQVASISQACLSSASSHILHSGAHR
jgi:hypothetical protein